MIINGKDLYEAWLKWTESEVIEDGRFKSVNWR